MQDHELKTLLADDFSKLVKSLNSPGFADAIVSKIKQAQRIRLWVIGVAGLIGALIAGVQISTVTGLALEALPGLFSTMFTNGVDASTMMLGAAASAVLICAMVLLPKQM